MRARTAQINLQRAQKAAADDASAAATAAEGNMVPLVASYTGKWTKADLVWWPLKEEKRAREDNNDKEDIKALSLRLRKGQEHQIDTEEDAHTNVKLDALHILKRELQAVDQAPVLL